jgi:hypothetical protein
VVVFFGRDSRHSSSNDFAIHRDLEQHHHIAARAALKDFPAQLESLDFDRFTLTKGGYHT